MPSVTRTFSVDPPPAKVIDYMKDFTNTTQWDPATQSCTRSDDGPIGVGSAWHNTSKVAGRTTELTYTLKESTNRTLVFIGENDASTSTDTITVDASGAGSVITYHVDLNLKGAAKLIAPVMKLVFERLATDTEKQLVASLNQL